MRVTLTVLRRGGQALRAETQLPVTGDLHTKRFKTGDTWVKVLAFQQTNSAPGMAELYDPGIKDCLAPSAQSPIRMPRNHRAPTNERYDVKMDYGLVPTADVQLLNSATAVGGPMQRRVRPHRFRPNQESGFRQGFITVS